MQPEIALIGVGSKNTFGHPNSGVLERLKNMETKIYRTDNNGEIEIEINSKGKIKVNTKINWYQWCKFDIEYYNWKYYNNKWRIEG